MQKQRINSGWLFWKDGHEAQAKPVTLPHDAMILERQDPALENGAATGFYPGGKYVYVKKLMGTPELTRGAAIVEFEGVYMDSHVFLNGEELGGRVYGYSNFFVDLTGKLAPGRENELKVVADNSRTPNSRWYSGSGIYRPVNLWTGGGAYVKPEGIKVRTLSIDPAVIEVTVDAVNAGDCAAEIEILYNNTAVASAKGFSARIPIPGAKLWSAETPDLYTVQVRLVKGGELVDTAGDAFGIRTLSWDSVKGFQVNGRTVKLRGGCVHHDHGILGAAAYDKAEYRRAKKLKAFGYNAIRYSHNPAGKNFLDVCDELGLYVIDEAFDQWKIPQTTYDYANHFDSQWRQDIAAMVSKDYNHPCVIMYGIGNEITDTGLPFGGQLCKTINAYMKSLDGTRPTMVAFNSMLCVIAHMKAMKAAGGEPESNATSQDANELVTLLANIQSSITPQSLEAIIAESASAVDIVGYNYGQNLYAGTREAIPERVILSSETFPARMDTNWQAVEESSAVIGDFHWTAWDYLGESGVGLPTYGTTQAPFSKSYPCRLASCGSFDLTGSPESAAYYAAVLWGAYQKPYIAVRPVDRGGQPYTLGKWRLTDSVASWTWPGCEGREAEVEVYSIGETARLLLDGTPVGEQPLVNGRAVFRTAYRPGTLTAVSYDRAGGEIARWTLSTAGEETVLRVCPEETAVRTGDIVFVPIEVTDQNGTLDMSKKLAISVSVEGPGELLALGSADPESTERFDGDTAASYHGRVLAVVRAAGEAGRVTVKAAAGGQTASASIAVK